MKLNKANLILIVFISLSLFGLTKLASNITEHNREWTTTKPFTFEGETVVEVARSTHQAYVVTRETSRPNVWHIRDIDLSDGTVERHAIITGGK